MQNVQFLLFILNFPHLALNSESCILRPQIKYYCLKPFDTKPDTAYYYGSRKVIFSQTVILNDQSI